MRKLNKYISKRRKLAINYSKILNNNKFIKPAQLVSTENSAHHLYPVEIDFTKTKISKAELMLELKKKGIVTQVHYMPIPLNPYYENLGYLYEDIPNAVSYYFKALSIPIYPGLKSSQQDKVIAEMVKILNAYR